MNPDRHGARSTLKGRDRNVGGAMLIALVIVLVLQIAFYPGVASWTYKALTGSGWDGSGLRYFQVFRILPAGLVLAVALAGTFTWPANRNHAPMIRIALVAWTIDLILFLLSVAWYASVVGGRLRG